MRTDLEDGYVLDRGFQVLLTAYPEVARHIDLDALDLRPFVRGVNVWDNGSFTELSDPRRSLTALVGGLRTQVLTAPGSCSILETGCKAPDVETWLSRSGR